MEKQPDVSLPEPVPHILVVDDDELIRQQIERLYVQSGCSVSPVATAEDALERLEAKDIDLVVTDIKLPGLSGVELTERIQELYPDIPVVVITGHAGIENAVEVLKLGATDYIVEPFRAAAIQESTRGVLEKSSAFIDIRHVRRILKGRYEFGGRLSKTPEMHRVFEVIRLVAGTDATVLIEGETGTGKELVANAIHQQSARRSGPFISINCAGFPETLLESELFWYERGAFTGADQSRPGKVELANRGTLFLDEIESIPLAMQAKLLLVLQDQKVQRLGSTKRVQIDMRVIAASNIPLAQLVETGEMRNDFYYRINVVPIQLIHLRQRREDVPLLVQDFLQHHQVALQRGIRSVSRHAMDQLMQHAWPGNVREMQNILERAIVLASGKVIENVDLPDRRPALAGNGQPNEPTSLSLRQWLAEQEKFYLAQQLEACGGTIGLTANVCDVDVKTLYRKMQVHGLDKKQFRSGDSNESEKSDEVEIV